MRTFIDTNEANSTSIVLIKTTVDGKATGLTDVFTNNSEKTFYIQSICYYFLSSDGTPNYDGTFNVGTNNPNYNNEVNGVGTSPNFQPLSLASTGKLLSTETLKVNVTAADTSVDKMLFQILVTGFYL